MVRYVTNALNDYKKAYELAQDKKYLIYENELINKFNNNKVSRDNL